MEHAWYWIAGIAAAWYILASAVSCTLYGLDKRAARRDQWRIAERTLWRWDLAGGWPGAHIAMRLFRHKRRKRAYMLRYYLIVALHVAVWIGVAYVVVRYAL